MPTPQRRQPVGVIARLLAEPHRFGFFQAVRLLNRWFGQRDRSHAIGTLTKRLHFRNGLSLSFPASEVAEFKAIGAPAEAGKATPQPAQPEEIERIEMTPAFMSLLGTGGALPIFYTEMLAERETYHRDTAARAFLDIFQHRAVSLFYESWRKHRLAVQYEDDQQRQFLPLVLAMTGIGQPTLRDRLRGREGGVADDTLAYFAGLLRQRPVSAAAIRQVVSEYFAVPARLDQFVGRWFTLPPDSSSSLGMACAVLGQSAVVGERVWQRDLRMRLTIGPMPRAKLRRFLPGGPAALALRELLSLMTGVAFEYEIRLALNAADVIGTALGESELGAHLGWDSFMVTQPVAEDRSDAGYDIHALA